jgi:hypothetical protein
MHHNAPTVLTAIVFAFLAACSRDARSQSANTKASSTARAKSAAQTTVAKNETTLPAYPTLLRGAMLGHEKSTGCKVYDAATNDAYDVVVTWYRSKLPGAKESPVTGMFTGMDFTINGTDHVTVYKSPQPPTAIILDQSVSGKKNCSST